MAIFQELTGQGRVVAGYMAKGDVVATKHGLSLQLFLVRRPLTDETVVSWEELTVDPGLIQKAGSAAIGVVVPGAVGRAIGASFKEAASSGHTVRIDWESGKQSVIELPNKLYSVLTTLLKDRQIVHEEAPVTSVAEDWKAGVANQVLGLATSVLGKDVDGGESEAGPSVDVMDQISKLSSLHAAGILTDEEFQAKKTELLGRL